MQPFLHYILIGFAMMFVVEGLLYALFPNSLKALLTQISTVSNDSLRWGGITIAVLGVVALYFLFS